MAALGVRKTAWNGLSVRNKTILRYIGSVLQLGTPSEFIAPGGAHWFIFDDHRFKAVVLAYFGCTVANLGDIPGGYTLPTTPGGGLDRPQLRSDIRAFCENPARTHPLVLPQDVVYPENDPNPWQTLLDAQGTPATVKMASGVPANWTPVVVP